MGRDVTQRRYIVTAKTMEGMNRLHDELSTDGITPTNTTIERSAMIAEERPASRSTTYFLTSKEALNLKSHPDVKAVQPHPEEIGVRLGAHEVTQTSNFNRGVGQNSNHKNWGLLRCVEGGVHADWPGDNTQTITLTETGKNVDCIIMDADGQAVGHPEFAVNVDGTGGSRVNLIDWYDLYNDVVGGQEGNTYNYGQYTSGNYHAIHVMGTVGGNTQGWARDANLYNIFYYAGDINNSNFPYVYDYVREFHKRKAINPDTGVKNPTVVNSSWGMSIFPSQWTFSNITAVTYRGTRYTATSTQQKAAGFSGIYDSSNDTELATFRYNNGTEVVDSWAQYNCTTSGTENPGDPEGALNPFPSGGFDGGAGWTISGGRRCFLDDTRKVQTTNTVYVETLPEDGVRYGDFTVDILQDITYTTPTGTVDLDLRVEVRDPDNILVATYTDGILTGASVNAVIDETITINKDGRWTISIITNYGTEPNPNCTFDTNISVTLNITQESTPSATATRVASGEGNVSIGDVSGLNVLTTPTSGNNDDGHWDLTLPFTVTMFQVDYTEIGIGTNSYITMGGGSSTEPNLFPENIPFPKIMIGSGNRNTAGGSPFTSCQRIYYGSEPTGNFATPVNTYSMDVVNNSNVAWTFSNGTDRNGAVSGDGPTITMLVGDTLEMTVNSNFAHPLYIKTVQSTGTGDQVPGVTNNGAFGGSTISWTPNTAGTFYYNCANHTVMNGTIVVQANPSTSYYRVVFEGNGASTGTLGDPGIRWEVRFDEENPTNFRVTIEENNQFNEISSPFTTQQLNDFGFIAGKRIPVPVDALDGDIEDAIDEGIINVSSAGNGQWYHAEPGDQDWDNTFEMGIRYPDSVNFPYYYMRGSSPGRYDTTATGGYDLPTIVVGAMGDQASLDEGPADYSDRGPGVTIWAPGTYVQSAYSAASPFSEPRNAAYRVAKISGTSMASPQVAGIIACLAQTYPEMTCEQARDLIVQMAEKGSLSDTESGNYEDTGALLGAPNLIVRYRQQRKTEGTTFPKRNFKARPESGQAYPRSRIRR
jgi:plastocyanin